MELEEEGWDSEMDALARWLEGYDFPQAPFTMGPALKVVDREKFLLNLKQQVDRAQRYKEEIPWLRARLRRLKEFMTSNE